MKKTIKRSRFFIIALLLCITSFSVTPNTSLAIDAENITVREMEKHLSIPENKANNLLHSLINIFHVKWLESFNYASEEESAVLIIMKEVSRTQVVGQYLTDLPVKAAMSIIKGAVKAARIFLTKDYVAILDEIEKRSVEDAVKEGTNILFLNELKIIPGAVEFKYTTSKDEERTVIFQYVIVYKSIGLEDGEILIRFHSIEKIQPPKNKGSIGLVLGIYTELTKDLEPFIVDVRGNVQDYKWVDFPTVKVDFPSEVPDLGIRPLGIFEKYVFKPIEKALQDVEVIFNKLTGKSLGLVDAWRTIKSTFSKIKSLAPASLISSVGMDITERIEEVEETILSTTPIPPSYYTVEEPVAPPTSPPAVTPPSEISLEEIQRILDEIAREIEILAKEFAKIAEEQEETEEEIASCININTAPLEELTKIIHIGTARAQQIIELRRGELFCKVEDLIRVSGIGSSTLEAIISQGLACVGREVLSDPKCKAGEEDFGGVIEVSGDSGSGTSTPTSKTQAKISLNFAENNPVNKELKVRVMASELKNASYDIKLSILERSEESEQKRTLSEIYNIEKWQSSYNYITKAFSGTTCSEEFTLRIREDKTDFRGEAEIMVRIRENGKSSYLEYKSKINIIAPEEVSPGDTPEEPEPEPTEPEPTEPEPTEPEEPPLEGNLRVVVNEIAWMGTQASTWDEWLELYNNTAEAIDLTEWKLIISEKEISLSGIIPAQGFYLLERDEKATNITADLVYDGRIKNEGEKIELWDNLGVLVDSVDFSLGWPAGKASPDYITMERINSKVEGSKASNWANNNLLIRNGLDTGGKEINGTPKAENSVSKTETRINRLLFTGEEITLTLQGSPYIVEGTLYVSEGKTLNIEPGVVLRFWDQSSGIMIDGTLKAEGLSNQHIVFTSYKDEEYGGSGGGPGQWRQLYFTPTSVDSVLDHVIIRYGGTRVDSSNFSGCHPDSGAVLVDRSSIVLKNSLIEHSRMRGMGLLVSDSVISNVAFSHNTVGCNIVEDKGAGLIIHGGSPTIKDSYFYDNYDALVLHRGTNAWVKNNIFVKNYQPIRLGSATALLEGNHAMDNEIDGIVVSATIDQDSLWLSGIPYIVKDLDIAEEATLTLGPGVVVRLKRDGIVRVSGKLKALGEAGKEVIFVGYSNGENNWRGLVFYADGSILDHTIIKHGGAMHVYSDMTRRYFAAITLDKAVSITVSNSVLEDNNYALYLYYNEACSLIQERMQEFMSMNTIFQNNKHDLFPERCSY